MKDHTNISDELLIAYIEGKLEEKEALKIENAIDKDNQVFSRYAILNRSFKQIEKTELEVTPDVLKEKLNLEFGIDQGTASNAKDNPDIFLSISNFFNKILQPTPIFGAVLSVFIIMLIISRQSDEIDSKKDIEQFLKNLNRTQIQTGKYLSSDSNSGIIVEYKDNKLIINQLIGIKRDIHIINSSRDYMEDFTITERENKIDIDKNILGDSIRVIIDTEGYAVFDSWIKIK